MIHIWHEDSSGSATNLFWEFLKIHRVSNVLINAEIKGFDGNANLHNHVCNAKYNAHDIYYIFIDCVPDNQKALSYYNGIKEATSNKKNVKVLDLLCFEYMLLKFRYLLNWIKPTKLTKDYVEGEIARAELIKVVESHNSWLTNPILVKYIVKNKGIDTNNQGWQRDLFFVSMENLASLILSKMTNGGTTEFGVSKTKLGKCWHCNCCGKYNSNKIGNAKCRMYRYGKKADDKARILWNHTDAHKFIK